MAFVEVMPSLSWQLTDDLSDTEMGYVPATPFQILGSTGKKRHLGKISVLK